MSRLWNKAYVTAHYAAAYASRYSGGRLTRRWHVYVPQVIDISGTVTWKFSARSVVEAWRLAAEAIEARLRHRRRCNPPPKVSARTDRTGLDK